METEQGSQLMLIRQVRSLQLRLALIFFAQFNNDNTKRINIEQNNNKVVISYKMQSVLINYNSTFTMNREFTRRRRDKGTQVNKRPDHTKGSKYGEKRVGLLGLLIMREVQEGTFITKQNLLKIIYDRKAKFQHSIHPFIYQCLKRVEQLQPSHNESLDNQSLASQYFSLLTSSNLFYQIQRNAWITTECISAKSLKFLFHKQVQREVRPLQTFSLKQLPLKILDFQIFKGTPPIAVLNCGHKLIGMTVSTNRQEQKQVFLYELSSKAQKYVLQKDSIFILLRNGNIIFGKMGQQMDVLDAGKAKFQQLKLCGSDILVLTKSYIIKIITTRGNVKKVIRAGVQISNVVPVFISTNLYVLIAEQEGKTCLLNCFKSGKNNYLQMFPEGLEKIEETIYIGKWILLRTQSQKIYAFALVNDSPVRIYEIYNGASPGMLKILHRKIIQS